MDGFRSALTGIAWMSSDRTTRRLRSIVDDADQLALFIGDMGLGAFRGDLKTAYAVERLLQRITEAVIQIGDEEMARIAPGIPVARIRAFGNRLRHEYERIDRDQVFAIASDDVPELRAAASRALEN